MTDETLGPTVTPWTLLGGAQVHVGGEDLVAALRGKVNKCG